MWWHIRYRYWLSRRTRLLERRQRTDNHQRRLQRIQFQSFPQFWWNKLFLGFFYENVNKRSQSISYNRHRIAGRHRYRLGIKEHVLDRLDERYRRSGQFGFQRSARPFQHKRKIFLFLFWTIPKIWNFLNSTKYLQLVNPRGIAVHPSRGLLFWSDWDRASPKIERANADGTDRRSHFITTSIQLPNSLTIDFERDDICWADAGVRRIGKESTAFCNPTWLRNFYPCRMRQSRRWQPTCYPLRREISVRSHSLRTTPFLDWLGGVRHSVVSFAYGRTTNFPFLLLRQENHQERIEGRGRQNRDFSASATRRTRETLWNSSRSGNVS